MARTKQTALVRRWAAPARVPAAPAAGQLVLDPAADTLDHVVRAVARSGFLPQAVRLMLASPEHLHDPELLYRTRGVRGAGGRTLLMRAVQHCDVVRAAEILGACPTPAARVALLACVGNDGFNALHLACSRRRPNEEAALRVVDLLLANGADALAPRRNPKTGRVWHSIHFAAQWSARLVQRLVQAGASIDGGVGATSTLLTAASIGTAQGVRTIPQLVLLGARETAGNGVMIALAKNPADWHGAPPTDAEVVAAINALVMVGCSLTHPDADGWTPLEWAAYTGNAPVVRALLSLGVPATSSSLLQGIEHPDIVRVLLAAGASPSALASVSGGGVSRTPLMEAASKSALESVQLLLATRLGASSVHRFDSTGSSALMYAVDSDCRKTAAVTRIVEALLDAGSDVRVQNHDGDTVLHCVARRHAKPWAAAVARLLRANGANVRTTNEDDEMPADLVPRGGGHAELFLALE